MVDYFFHYVELKGADPVVVTSESSAILRQNGRLDRLVQPRSSAPLIK
jgi:hypothetical protein